MGNSIKETFDHQGRINWKFFETREFYVMATDRIFTIDDKILEDLSSNLMKGVIFDTFLRKIVEFWNNDYFVANLLIVLKNFLDFSLREQKDLSYLFFNNLNTNLQEKLESKEISIIFLYREEEKCLSFNIGTLSSLLLQDEVKIIEYLVSLFPDLEQDLKEKNCRITLKSLQNDVVSTECLSNYYLSRNPDTLINPFEEEVPKSPLKVKIEIKELDFSTVFHNFLKFILSSASSTKLGVFLVKSQAMIEFLLTTLSLHFLPTAETDLNTFKPLKPSAIFRYLKEIDSLNGQQVSLSLLDYVVENSNPPKRFTYFSSFFASSLDLRLAEIEESGPRSGLFLLLLLNSFSFFNDVFFIRDADLKWLKFSKYFTGMIKDTQKLMLFTVLVIRNPIFLNDFVNSSEVFFLVKELNECISENPDHCFKNDLILIIFLKLTENKAFLVKAFKEKQTLENWVSYAELADVNLGSLMFLSMIRVAKENLKRNHFDFVQTYSSAILFNLSTQMIDLHEVSVNEFLLLIKTLHSNYVKNLESNKKLANLFIETCHVYLEYLGRIMQKGLSLNPAVIRSCLNHSEFFKAMNSNENNSQVVKEIVKCLAVFERYLEREDSEDQLKITCKLQGFGPLKSEFWNFNECRYFDDYEKWEAFAVPQVWKMILIDRKN